MNVTAFLRVIPWKVTGSDGVIEFRKQGGIHVSVCIRKKKYPIRCHISECTASKYGEREINKYLKCKYFQSYGKNNKGLALV